MAKAALHLTLVVTWLAMGQAAGCKKQISQEEAPAAPAPVETPRACSARNPDLCMEELAALGTTSDAKTVNRRHQLLGLLCEGKKAIGCHYLGKLLRETDEPRALDLLARGCDLGSQEACYEAGALHLKAKKAPRNPAKALVFLEKSCSGGNARGCFNSGAMVADGEGAKKDPARARQLYNRGCTLKDPSACYNFAVMCDQGEGGPRDAQKARGAFTAACAGKISLACYNLGVLTERGEGVSRDQAEAADWFGKACALSFVKGCYDAGVLYSTGDHKVRDAAKALARFTRGCTLNHGPSCLAQAQDLELRKKPKKNTLALFLKACDLSVKTGCRAAARLLTADRQWESAVSPLEKACAMKDMESCVQLADLARDGRANLKDRRDRYEQLACEAGEVKKCLRQARRHARGKGAPKDAVLAAKMYRKACELGHAKTCLAMGRVALRGTTPDREQALKWFAAGCRLKLKKACHEEKRLRSKGR